MIIGWNKVRANISSQGENFVSWIPKECHDKIKKMKGKQVRVTTDDEI